MKKCKFLYVRITDFGQIPKLVDTMGYKIWNCTTIEKTLNEYLAQGYEVKQIVPDEDEVFVYLEKDV